MINKKKIKEALKNVTVHGWGVVDLRNCGLTEIPKVLYNHPDIVSIDMSNSDYANEDEKNKVTEIPDEIANIKRLARLNFDDNNISKVTEDISKLTRLKYLNLKVKF